MRLFIYITQEIILSLASKIQTYIKTNPRFSLTDLYEQFGGNYQKHSIRARVYENTKVIRVGRGSYVLAGAELEATIAHADSREYIFEIMKIATRYDLIFFDIPYSTKAQRSGGNGNRNMATYDLISPDEFRNILLESQKMLRTEQSQIYFMISNGVSSKKEAQTYIDAFGDTSLKLNDTGSYTKLTSSGKVCNMGQYEMPPELILSFSHDGLIRDCTGDGSYTLDFKMERPKLARYGGFQTHKPLKMLQQMVGQATFLGEAVLDMFAGSGEMLSAALGLGRKVHVVEKSLQAIDNFILPRMEHYAAQSRNWYQTSIFDYGLAA